MLQLVSAQLEYVSEYTGAAAALDLAFLFHFFGGLLGFYHGARIMEAENLPVTQLGEMIQVVAPALGAIVNADAQRIAGNTYEAPESNAGQFRDGGGVDPRSRVASRAGFPFRRLRDESFRAGITAGHEAVNRVRLDDHHWMCAKTRIQQSRAMR